MPGVIIRLDLFAGLYRFLEVLIDQLGGVWQRMALQALDGCSATLHADDAVAHMTTVFPLCHDSPPAMGESAIPTRVTPVKYAVSYLMPL
jgi:hypothetical protein